MKDDTIIVKKFITACEFMNQGCEKELKFNKLKICVLHDAEEHGKYNIKVYKN